MNIAFPYHLGTRGVTALEEDADHIEDMIEQFLFTASGERVMLPELGSGLMQLLFAPTSPEVAAALQFTVQGGLQRWLGDVIDVHALEVSTFEAGIRVRLEFAVRRTGETRTRIFERSLV
jgi:phage baseplate assembly protein W